MTLPQPTPEIAAYLAAGAAHPLPSYVDLGAVAGRVQYRTTVATNWGPVAEHAGLEVSDAALAGVPVRIHRPASGRLPVVVYFHGGGWVIGDLDT
ncbi:MAG: Esterase/lipase, partial [Nocardioidaceae bacterium]|nr:Esterase/lipase [Nocardioidaceae bacterium]